MSKGVQIAIGASLVALLLGWTLVSRSGREGAFRYFQNLESFLAAAAESVGRPTRVHGYVVPASIERDLAQREVRFRIQNAPPHAGGLAHAPLSIVFPSLETPDLFKDGAEVVVEGRLEALPPDGVFRADKVMAKCPSKFEGAVPGAAPGAAS